MNRRTTLQALTALLMAPLAAMAQPAGKVPRLCFLTFEPATLETVRFKPNFEALRALGYEDKKTINIDFLSSQSGAVPYSSVAEECVRRRVDIIVTATTPATQAAKSATRTIPIVMLLLGDPVGTGLVQSLARPGGNVTGQTYFAPELAAKRLQLLKELRPTLSRVLVLSHLVDPIAAGQIEAMNKAASILGVSLIVRDIRTVDDLPGAFEAGIKERADSVLTTAESIFLANHVRVVELASRHRLPAVYPGFAFVDAGGLMSYSAKREGVVGRFAAQVDKILKGAKPADMPVEGPTHFEFVVNLKTAATLGIKVPRAILVGADRLIE